MVDRIAFFARGQPRLADQRQQAVAGDAGQDRARERGGEHRAIIEDEEQVHPAQLLDPFVLGRIEEQHLIMAAREGFGGGDEARRIIAAAFGRPRAARRRAGVFGHPERDGGRARFEVIAGGAGDDDEFIGLGRAHAQEGFGGDHEGAQVQRGAFLRRDPCAVGRDQQAHRFEEGGLGQGWHGKARGAGVEPCRVRLGAEQRDGAIGMGVGFEPLEDFLRVMEHGGGRIERDGDARADHRIVPAFCLAPFNRHHMVGEIGAKARIGQHRGAGVGRGGGGVGLMLEG